MARRERHLQQFRPGHGPRPPKTVRAIELDRETDAATRYRRVASATALIWKILVVAQSRFRRLDAAELLADVYHEVTYVDGLRTSERKGGVAA